MTIGLVQLWEGGWVFLNPPFGPRVEQRLLEVIPGEVRRPDHRGNCIVGSQRPKPQLEDADGDIVPGVFSFGPYPVYWAFR